MSDLLHHFVEIRVEMTDAELGDECIQGTCVLDADLLQKLRELGTHDVARDVIIVDDDPRDVHEIEFGDVDSITADIELLPYRLSNVEEENQRAYYFETLSDLIQRFTTSPPQTEYYVHNSVRSFSSGEEVNENIKRYESLTELIGLLSKISDFEDRSSGVNTLIFFQDSKLTVPVTYSEDALCDLDKLDNLKEELSRQGEGETRREVFRRTLVDYLSPTPPDDRFSEIVESFGSIYQKYYRGHQRYLREFSYERLKSSFVEDKAKYIKELHDIVNEVQNKLITIPLALLLVGGQLRPEAPFSAENFAILFGALVLTIMLVLIINNQKIVLDDVREEIKELKGKYLKKDPKPPAVIREGFDRLYYTHDKQISVINLFNFLVWIFMISTISLLLFYKLKHDSILYYKPISVFCWLGFMIIASLYFRIPSSTLVLLGLERSLGNKTQ